MSRPESTVVRVEHELRAMIRQTSVGGDPILPSLRQLARQLHASRGTVLKAVQRLRHQGLIVSAPRRGYLAAATPPSTPSPARNQPPTTPPSYALSPRWRTVARAIRRDILEGRFAAGSLLPSGKELRAHYGCGDPSLQNAIRSLCEEGRLAPHGRRYEIRGAMPHHSSAALVFTSLGAGAPRFSSLTPHSAELWRSLERECHRRHLRLVTCNYAAVADASHETGATTVGYIMSTLASNPALQAAALRTALSTGLPVALLDENSRGAELLRKHASTLLRGFAMGTSEVCGGLVGEYLLSRGHRRVVFVAPHDTRAARTRWAGVCKPFEQAGLRDSVMFRSMALPDSGEVWRSARYTALRNSMADAELRYASHERNAPRAGSIMGARSSLTFAISVLAHAHAPSFCAETLQSCPSTAWVAYNDDIALVLLEQLRGMGVQLPRDLSLIGFDDTLEGIAHGLTTYSFNIPAIVGAMLEHVLAPKRTSPRAGIVEIPGMVLERKTSGIVSAEHGLRSGLQA